MSKTSELQLENNLKGFETFVKEEIRGIITLNVMSGVYDRKSWVFRDYELFEEIVDGLYVECVPQLRDTIREVVESNFECLNKVS